MDVSDSRAAPGLRVHLTGAFRVESAGGADLTPKSAKGAALLALLACHPQARRSRSWLQARLWSERGREQAAASLRQALSQLRRSLGPGGEVLQVSRAFVALNRDRVELVRTPGGELFEGIEVRDPAFAEWLGNERRAWSGRGAPACESPGAAAGAAPESAAPRLAALRRTDLVRQVHVFPLTPTQGPERLFEDLFIDGFERWVSEALIAEVHRRPPDPSSGDPISVAVQAYAAGGKGFGLRLQMQEAQSRRMLWSGRKVIEAQGAPPVDHIDFLSLVHEATEALADALVLRLRRDMERADAAILGRLALHKVFTMNVEEVIHADHLFQRAHELDPRAIFLAWRAQLRIIQEMERHAAGEGRAEEIERLARAALRLEPSNSVVLAVAANAQLLVANDVHAGMELAQRAVDLNPVNPFAWDALSIGLAMSGKPQEAHLHQLRAFAISQRSPIRHFWDMGACLTSVATGKLDLARRLAHNAAVMAPDFRPPLRYMATLDAIAGDRTAALQSVEKLRRLEPDFSLRQMVEDESYPVAGLRRAGLLNSGKLRDLT